MKTSRKFSHFEVFRIVVNTLYITSGLIMLILWCNNVSTYVEENYITYEKYDKID